jgi:hypothetical protein
MNLTFWEAIIVLVILLLPVLALVDIFKSSFRASFMKIVWILLVVFLPALGTILYFSVRSSQKVKG